MVDRRVDHLPLPGAAQAAKKGGALPPPSSLPCGARGEAGTRGAPPRHACRSGCGQSVPTRVQSGFRGKDFTTTGRAPPSERGALGLSKACAT